MKCAARAFRMPGFSLVAAVCLVATGCVIRSGANPRTYYFAERPRGLTVTVDWVGPSEPTLGTRAELIATADSGVYLLHERVVVFYPRPADARLLPRRAPGVATLDLRDATVDDMSQAARHSRYPFGLAEPVLHELLESLGQDSVLVRRIP